MADTMTLEQVRDEMRAWRSHTGFESGRLLGWADAIDAAIEQREQGAKDAAERLCRIYFEIAAEAVGEDEVRRRRDAAIKESGR